MLSPTSPIARSWCPCSCQGLNFATIGSHNKSKRTLYGTILSEFERGCQEGGAYNSALSRLFGVFPHAIRHRYINIEVAKTKFSPHWLLLCIAPSCSKGCEQGGSAAPEQTRL